MDKMIKDILLFKINDFNLAIECSDIINIINTFNNIDIVQKDNEFYYLFEKEMIPIYAYNSTFLQSKDEPSLKEQRLILLDYKNHGKIGLIASKVFGTKEVSLDIILTYIPIAKDIPVDIFKYYYFEDKNVILVITLESFIEKINKKITDIQSSKDDSSIAIQQENHSTYETKKQISSTENENTSLYKILYIDDSMVMHKLVIPNLIKQGYEVYQAFDGEEGLKMAMEIKPDLLITDVEMPGKTGLEVVQHLKSNNETFDIYAIIITSLGAAKDIHKGFEVGADDYLHKPLNIEELIQRIKQFFRGREMKGRENILLIGHSNKDFKILLNSLKLQGFGIFHLDDYIENLLEDMVDKIDIIIADLDNLNVMALDLCLAVKKNPKIASFPLVLICSSCSANEYKMLISQGASIVITRPFSIDKILLNIERLLAENRLLKENKAMKLYMSDATLRAVENRNSPVSIHRTVEEKIVTILFTDIVGFTATCEKYSPQEIVLLLNRFFEMATKILKKYDATVDKYIGDAIFTFFEAIDHTLAAENAVMAAYEIIQQLAIENFTQEPKIKIRIGINTGNVVMGDIGSLELRKDYTIIGDNVNIANRLESNALPMRILISETTYDLIKDKYEYDEVRTIELKGKTQKIKTYLLKEKLNSLANI